MPEYEAQVTVTVMLSYDVVLRVEANSLAEAETKLRWEAMGMKRQDLDRCVEAHADCHYDGQTTAVESVGQIEEVPVDGDEEGPDAQAE